MPQVWPFVVVCSVLSVACGTAAAVSMLSFNHSATNMVVLGYIIVSGLAALLVVLSGAIALYTCLEDHVRRTRSADATN